MTGSPRLLPSWKSSAPGARRDVDDAGALVLADLGPRHDAVDVLGLLEGLADGRQVVERAHVLPAGEIAAGQLFLDRERADERACFRTPFPTQALVALADLDVAQVRPDGGGDVGRERPRGRRPDEERLAGPVDERQLDRQARDPRGPGSPRSSRAG